MATNTEKLLLQTDIIVNGQQQLITLAGQLTAVQNAQAASSARAATSLASLDRGLAALPAREVAAATGATAMATAVTAATTVFNELYAATHRIIEIGQEITDTGFQFDRWQAQFTVLEHSPDKAKQKLLEFQAFADKFNLPLPQVVEAAAALDRVGILSERSLTAVAAASRSTGHDMVEIAERVNAASRGMFRGILDYFPAASSKLLAFTQEVEAGAKKSPEALNQGVNLALDEMLTRYSGALDQAKSLTQNKLVGISNRLEIARNQIAHSGWDDALGDVVDHMLEELDRLDKNGTLAAWAKDMGKAAALGAHALELVVQSAPAVIRALQFTGALLAAEALARGFEALVPAIEAIVAFMPEISAFVALWGEYGLVQALSAATVGMEGFAGTLYTALGPVGIFALAVGGLLGTVNLLHDAVNRRFDLRVNLDRASADDINRELHRVQDELEKTSVQAAVTSSVLDAVFHHDFSQGFFSQAFDKAKADADELTARMAVLDAKALGLYDFGSGAGGHADKTAGGDAKTKADKAAYEAMLAQGKQYLADVQKIGQEATRDFMEQLNAEVEATGATGAAKAAIYEQYAARDRQRLLANGALRKQFEAELEDKVAHERADIAAAVDQGLITPAAEKEFLRRADIEERTGKAAIAAAFGNAQVKLDIDKKVTEEGRKLRAVGDKDDADARARLLVADAQFERDIYGLTTDQYLLELKRRLAGLVAHSAAAKAIQDEINAVSNKKGAGEDIIVGRAARFNQAGISNENANAASNEEAVNEEAAKRLQEIDQANFDLRVAQLDAWKGLHGKAVADMTETELRSHAASVEAAKRGYGSMTTTVGAAFKTMGTFAKAFESDEALRLKIISYLTQKNAKEAVAAYADEKAQELKITAIDAAVTGFLDLAKHDFTGAAAAFKASALAGGESFVAAAVGREFHSLATQAGEEPGRGAAAGGGGGAAAGATSGGGSPANSLSISQGNQPITNNWYNSVTLTGGTIFLDRAGAAVIVDMLTDAINDKIDSGAIRPRR